MLSIKEWSLDAMLHRYLWTPFKWMGNKLDFLRSKWAAAFFAMAYAAGTVAFAFEAQIPASLYAMLPVMYAFFALALILSAFAERGNAIGAWLLVFAAQLLMALAIALNEHFNFGQVLLYLSGTVLSAFTGWLCLKKIASISDDIELNGFHGYVYEHPVTALLFLLSCLGMLGFPITPSFIGIDLLFSHIRDQQYLLIGFIALCFVFIELSVMRIYARIFLGQHKRPFHAIAYRSS